MAATMLNNSRLLLNQITRCECTRFVKHYNKYSHAKAIPIKEETRTLAQRLKEIEDHLQDGAKVNIGLASSKIKKLSRRDRRKLQEDKNIVELEKQARNEELVLPLEEFSHGKMDSQKQHMLHRVAAHYGIFKDMFGGDFFYPETSLTVMYEKEGAAESAETGADDEEITLNPVFYGNVLDPSETSIEPVIEFDGKADKLYTLCMTAPDSHLQDNNLEYLHWMVGNIPGSAIDKGTVLCDYLRPFPTKGTGFHRYVFVLYQHDNAIDFSEEKKTDPCTSLRERSFSSGEFYQKHRTSLAPVGLAFFQSEWDETVRKTFHNILDMGEPRFEYIVPHKYIPKQQHWPLREPFNVYMDRYRDIKDLNEEVLREKLKTAHPFMPRPPPRKYPNVYRPDRSQPSWLRQKINDQVLRKAQWKALDD